MSVNMNLVTVATREIVSQFKNPECNLEKIKFLKLILNDYPIVGVMAFDGYKFSMEIPDTRCVRMSINGTVTKERGHGYYLVFDKPLEFEGIAKLSQVPFTDDLLCSMLTYKNSFDWNGIILGD